MAFTIKNAVECMGIGLHSGVETQVKLLPAQAQAGRYFVRVDLPNQPLIPAILDSVGETTLSTQLTQGSAQVRTVEHLLAALTGFGVNDVRIEINSGEVPLLDGSALVWLEQLQKAQLCQNSSEDQPLFSDQPLTEPIWIYEGDMFVAAIPAPETRFSYGVDYPYSAIGNQWYSWHPARESFNEAIAPARTFGFADQVEKLRQMGLIKGGSLDNALVCDQEKWLNPPLRFTNEPVRHKLLDLVGDLSLLGTIPQAHYLAYKASHNLHIRLAKQLALINSQK
jgi:UDP-3-O-[3-hydroxymyristoyl] N-acetylglucosamine deacetylase